MIQNPEDLAHAKARTPCAPDDEIEVYAHAVRSLLELVSGPERQLKQLGFVDIYAHLDDKERLIYQQCYALGGSPYEQIC